MKTYKVKLIMSEEYHIKAESKEVAAMVARAKFGSDYYIDDVEINGESEEGWFGYVRWNIDDLKVALEDKGYPDTEENISKLYDLCSNHYFTDYMIAAGWDYIYGQIGANKCWETEEE